jgi:hypothetical protein
MKKSRGANSRSLQHHDRAENVFARLATQNDVLKFQSLESGLLRQAAQIGLRTPTESRRRYL